MSIDRRPRLHFTPPAGWLNDPNGLIYHAGEYHLFYQHHPYSLVWGPMHWGHAVSRDLVHWEHLPIALAPDELGAIFSGSAVIDRHNTAGFGAGALITIFTHHQEARQVQSLAYSSDDGRSWTKYAGNPVLAPPDAPLNFRDPRVFWYGAAHDGHWVMALAVDQEIWLYTSPDLKRWTKASAFGAGYGEHAGVWECPELLSLAIDGGPERCWVLIVSVQHGAPAGGSGTQYFVGAFDGATFTCADPPGTVRWADYGADFYAAQAWNAAPGERTLWLAWMNNWEYARETPARKWRGMISAPREVSLTRTGERLTLVQRLAPELTANWPISATLRDQALGEGGYAVPGGPTLLITATFSVASATAQQVGLRVGVGGAAATSVTYAIEDATLTVDRTWAGAAFSAIAPRQTAPLAAADGLIRLEILVDTGSIEVFAADGSVTLTSQIFPEPASTGVEVFAVGGAARLVELKIRTPEG